MKQIQNILIIGGAGYVGSVLSKDLKVEGYSITCIDNILYEDQQNNLDDNIQDPNFIKLDFRLIDKLKEYLIKSDCVILLGGLVGEFITKKYLALSKSINENGIKKIIDEIDNFKNIKNLIFVSTCSNYGITESDNLVNEEHELKPLSPYAIAKVEIENYIISKKKTSYAPTVLRFATAFGFSPRMRFDLTVNHFCYSLYKDKKIEVFDPDTWRPYCHVKDFSRLILRVLEVDRKLIDHEVFNVGSNENNFSKRQIATLINKKLPSSNISYAKGGVDKRDYRVSFEKVFNILNFKAKYSVEYGIEEILKLLKSKDLNYLNEDALKKRGNFQILDHVK